MKFFKGIRAKSVKTGKRLVAYDQLSQGVREQSQIAKDIFDYNTKEITSTQENFYFSQKAVADAQKGFKKLFIVFVGLFIFAILYFIANLIARNWTTALLSIAFALVCASLAFRYHFWLYQIKKKTLGLRFADYYKDEVESHLKKQDAPVQKDRKETK